MKWRKRSLKPRKFTLFYETMEHYACFFLFVLYKNACKVNSTWHSFLANERLVRLLVSCCNDGSYR